MYDNDFYGYLQQIQPIVQSISKWNELYQQQARVIEQVLEPLQEIWDFNEKIQSTINSVVEMQTQIMSDWNLPSNVGYLQNTLSMQMEALLQSYQSVNTQELNTLMDHFQHADWTRGMETFLQSIQEPFTQAANIAFLRNAEHLGTIWPENSPSGLKTFTRSIRKYTAQRLASTTDIEVNCKDKIFRSVHSPEHVVNVNGMNLLASSTELFEEIKEVDLMELMAVLARTPEFAFNCEAGRKIWEIIRDWDNFIDFDQEYFYHARAMAENGCPYTGQEMSQAPHFYVGMGRYNHVGQSHYYFSDNEKGARIEVCRHNRGARVQIARLRPQRRIRLLDLSEEITRNNLFLQYIRFDAGNGTAPREYLIPCYVASCCRRAGIEGIKYYGSKEYKNYVSWTDGYFDVETTWEI